MSDLVEANSIHIRGQGARYSIQKLRIIYLKFNTVLSPRGKTRIKLIQGSHLL